MDPMERLTQHIQEPAAYLCLHLLEAAVASWRYWTGEIPGELIDDIRAALGDDLVEQEIANLVSWGILVELHTAEARIFQLKEQLLPDAASLLQTLRCQLELEAGGIRINAQEYLNQLIQYLQFAAEGLSVQETGKDTYRLEWKGETYRFLLTVSPFWLPLATEREEDQYLIAVGPFAAQSWETMFHYYDVEEFRTRVGMYDLWSQEKMSLCKGPLSVYLDWFHRDKYRGRFSIPTDFCDALNNMGLMRYNDER